MPKHGRVVVVGSSNTDLVVHCARLPSGGATVLGGDLLTFAGGKGANQAVAAARAGAKVHFIGAFGDDAFGKARRADLEREGVDCSGCVVKKGVPSGVALIAIGKGDKGQKAENQIVVAPGANSRLTLADVKRGMPRDLNWQDVVLCSLEVPASCVSTALELATLAAATSILNPAPLSSKRLPKGSYLQASYLTPNESEFAGLAGCAPGSTAQKRLARILPAKRKLLPAFLITRGPRGAALLTREAYTGDFVKAPKVKAVDTVGAGDCFNGALAASLALGEAEPDSLSELAAYAVAAASLKVTRHGAQAGMPYRSEILSMLKRMK